MFPHDFAHSSNLNDWYCTMALCLGLLWAIGWSLAFIITYVVGDWDVHKEGDRYDNRDHEGPWYMLGIALVGGMGVAITWPAIPFLAVGLLLWGALDLVHKAYKLPERREKQRIAAVAERQRAIEALEDDLDLMPIVPVSRETVDRLKSQRMKDTP